MYWTSIWYKNMRPWGVTMTQQVIASEASCVTFSSKVSITRKHGTTQWVRMTLNSLAAVESYRLKVESYPVDTCHTFFFVFGCIQVHNYTIHAAAKFMFSGNVTSFLHALVVCKRGYFKEPNVFQPWLSKINNINLVVHVKLLHLEHI